MTVGEARLLLKEGAKRRATFLELFFDVVFVFAFTRISTRSAEVLTGPDRHIPSVVATGLGKALLLLLALWAVWHAARHGVQGRRTRPRGQGSARKS